MAEDRFDFLILASSSRRGPKGDAVSSAMLESGYRGLGNGMEQSCEAAVIPAGGGLRLVLRWSECRFTHGIGTAYANPGLVYGKQGRRTT